MQYRKFGSLDFEVSALGFGAMRMPTLPDSEKVDEKKALEMIHYAFDHGVNYIDTAYPYHGGQSEEIVGKALKGYREKVKLATKLPTWLVEKKEDMDRLLNEQLEKLDVEQIDFYLLHALNKEKWNNMLSHDVFNWVEKVQKQGKIKHIGFSFHDEYPLFEEIVDAYDKWVFTQIQYNYMDINFQAGAKGMKYAHDKGLAVIVMEPLKGGKLTGRVPESVQNVFDQSDTERSAADWALQWLWDQKEVSLVLSGMSTMQHVKENVESAANSGIDSLSEKDKDIIKKAQAEYKKLIPIPCTKCKYCMPCPNGVDIPGNFDVYNELKMFGDMKNAKRAYKKLEEAQAGKCIECGKCEPLCPQNIKIQKWLKTIDNELDN